MNITSVIDTIEAAYEFQTQVDKFCDVEGHLQPIEGYALLQLAANGPRKGAIVEIGSFMGLSTCWLATGSKGAGREQVTAIDHFDGSPEHQEGGAAQCNAIIQEGTTYHKFHQNLSAQGLWNQVDVIAASSEAAANSWDKEIRLLFIDGEHSWDGVSTDFTHWSPFVVRGGLIAFHDVGNAPDVTRFYQELIGSDQGYTHLFQAASLAVAQKEVSASSSAAKPLPASTQKRQPEPQLAISH